MLDLDRDVIRDFRELAMKGLDQFQGMPNAVEKIRIAKRNVLRPSRHLPPNIFQHHVALHDAENAVVHRNNWAMPAQMLAPAARFRRSDNAITVARNYQI